MIKSLVLTLFVIVCYTLMCLADTWGYFYKLSGNATYNNKPIINDTIGYYYFPRADSKRFILTDANGNYKVEVEVTGSCMSASQEKCLNMTFDECYFAFSKRYNSDTLTFTFKGRYVKVKNEWLEILKAQRSGSLKPD
ncbi:MAG TPA: hypothetical protein PLJ43_14190, partial [Chitinophagales bacterium]|nr:hypothetical protein [Chitinophagales bacterium]